MFLIEQQNVKQRLTEDHLRAINHHQLLVDAQKLLKKRELAFETKIKEEEAMIEQKQEKLLQREEQMQMQLIDERERYFILFCHLR